MIAFVYPWADKSLLVQNTDDVTRGGFRVGEHATVRRMAAGEFTQVVARPVEILQLTAGDHLTLDFRLVRNVVDHERHTAATDDVLGRFENRGNRTSLAVNDEEELL